MGEEARPLQEADKPPRGNNGSIERRSQRATDAMGNAILGGGRIDPTRLYSLIHAGEQYPCCRPYGRVPYFEAVLGRREGIVHQKRLADYP
jgi:hypothetical protein